MTDCTKEKNNILKSSLDSRDITVLIAKHAVQVTYYQSNHHNSLILTWPSGPMLKVKLVYNTYNVYDNIYV
jgi:hypothetical protein